MTRSACLARTRWRFERGFLRPPKRSLFPAIGPWRWSAFTPLVCSSPRSPRSRPNYRIGLTLYSGEAGRNWTIRIVSLPCSLRSICICMAKAPTTRAIARWARIRRRAKASRECASRCGRRTPEVVSVVGDFNRGTARAIPCACATAASGRYLCPASVEARTTNTPCSRGFGAEQQKSDPYGFFAEVPPKTASIVWPISQLCMERRASGWRRAARADG